MDMQTPKGDKDVSDTEAQDTLPWGQTLLSGEDLSMVLTKKTTQRKKLLMVTHHRVSYTNAAWPTWPQGALD